MDDHRKRLNVLADLQKKRCCKVLLVVFATILTGLVLAFTLLRGAVSLPEASGSDTFSPHNSLVFPVNGLYCDQFSISKYHISPASLWNTSLYILNEAPDPSQTDRYNFTVSKGGVGDFLHLKPGEYYQWSFHLLNGSQYSVSACVWLSSNVTLHVLKGESDFNDWTKSEWSAAGHVLPPCNTTGRPVLITAEKVQNNYKYYFVYKSISADITSVWIQMNFSSLDYAIGTNTSNIFASCSCLYSNYNCSHSLPMNFKGVAVVKTFTPEDASWEEQLYVTWVCEASYTAYLLLVCLPFFFYGSCLLLLTCIHQLCNRTPVHHPHQPHRISRSNARLLFAMDRVICVFYFIFVMSVLVLFPLQFLQYVLEFGNLYVTLYVLVSMAIGVLCCFVSSIILQTCVMKNRVVTQSTVTTPGPTSNRQSQQQYIPVSTTEHQDDTAQCHDDTAQRRDDTAQCHDDTTQRHDDTIQHQDDPTQHQDDPTQHQDDIAKDDTTEHQDHTIDGDTTEHQDHTTRNKKMKKFLCVMIGLGCLLVPLFVCMLTFFEAIMPVLIYSSSLEFNTTLGPGDTHNFSFNSFFCGSWTIEGHGSSHWYATLSVYNEQPCLSTSNIVINGSNYQPSNIMTIDHNVYLHEQSSVGVSACLVEGRKAVFVVVKGSSNYYSWVKDRLPKYTFDYLIVERNCTLPLDEKQIHIESADRYYFVHYGDSNHWSNTDLVLNLSLVEYSPYYENGTQCSISPHTVDTCTATAPGIGDMTWLVAVSCDPSDSAKCTWDESVAIDVTCNLRADTWAVLWVPVFSINAVVLY